MNFNEQQSKQVYDFIMNYNNSEKFRNNVLETYKNNPEKMSILEIYTLEEVLRVGNKELFSKFLLLTGSYTLEEAVKLYDDFILLLNTDNNFKQFKLEQLNSNSTFLSKIELFILQLIDDEIEKPKEEKLEYDSLNEILFNYDYQIRKTLENLLLGKFVRELLDMPELKEVKERQKNGCVANIDKPIIIERLRSIFLIGYNINKFKNRVNDMYVKVKMDILLGKGELAFSKFIGFNTNISVEEVLGKENDTTVNEMYDYLQQIVHKRKTQGSVFSEEDAMDVINQLRKKKK